MKRILFSVFISLSFSTFAFAEPVILESEFDPAAGPNGYTLVFPPEISSSEVFLPIVGGRFEIEIDADAGTSRLLSWKQEISPIELFGADTGPISVSVHADEPSSGTYDPGTREFSVSAAFLIEFDDTELQQFGFISPVTLVGTEHGNIAGAGASGTIHMFLQGDGEFAGGTFTYTCQTTAGWEIDLGPDQAAVGDANRDGGLDLSDPIEILSALFLGGAM